MNGALFAAMLLYKENNVPALPADSGEAVIARGRKKKSMCAGVSHKKELEEK